MFTLILLSVFVGLFDHSLGQNCCQMNECDFEKIEISNQLLALASQIQSSVNTNRDCKIPGESPSATTSIPATTADNWTSTTADNWPSTTTDNWPSTTADNWPSTTADNWTSTTADNWPTSTTVEPVSQGYVLGTSKYQTQSSASTHCVSMGHRLVRIKSAEAWTELRAKVMYWYRPGGGLYTTTYTAPLLLWTSGALDPVDGAWKWPDGTPVDFSLLPPLTSVPVAKNNGLAIEYVQKPEPNVQIKLLPLATTSFFYPTVYKAPLRALCEIFSR